MHSKQIASPSITRKQGSSTTRSHALHGFAVPQILPSQHAQLPTGWPKKEVTSLAGDLWLLADAARGRRRLWHVSWQLADAGFTFGKSQPSREALVLAARTIC